MGSLLLTCTTRCHTTWLRPLIFLLVLTGLVAAGPGVRLASGQQSTLTLETVTPRRALTAAVQMERKSPTRALLYSLGGTVGPTAAGLLAGDSFGGVVILLGVGLGPAAGHFYAGDSRQAWIGTGLRAVGSGVFVVGAASEVAEACLLCSEPSSTENGSDVNAAMIGGALLAGGSALYDIVTAPGSAREYNEAHGLSARVAPAVGPRGAPVGLALHLSF